MAIRKISDEELKKILRLHELWLESSRKNGKQADLGGADLRGVNLRETNLSNADLFRTYLSEANLRGADLSGANLSGANLRGANLRGANLRETNLYMTYPNKANLNRAFGIPEWIQKGLDKNGIYTQENLIVSIKDGFKNLIGANLLKANLIGADLNEANLRKAYLSEADLRGAYLSRANLSEAYLYRTDFRESNILEVNFSDSKLERTDFRLVKCLSIGNWSDAQFNGTIMDSYLYNKLPKELREANKGKIFIQDSITVDDPNAINRSIEFPSEYCESSKSILSYFGTVLQQKYPDKKTKVKIEQNGLKITMIIEIEEGDKEEIEKFLNQYGLVVRGEMEPEELLSNRLQVMELKQELKFAKQKLEYKQELLDFAKADLSEARNNLNEKSQELKETRLEMKELRSLIGQSLQTTQAVSNNHTKSVEFLIKPDTALQSLITTIQTLIEKQTNGLEQSLQTIVSNIQNPHPTKQEQDAVIQSIETIQKKAPTLYQELVDGLSNFTIGVGSSVWATVIIEVLKKVGV